MVPHPPGTGSLQLGVFLPVANNGWVLSSEADPAPPTFALNRLIAQRAEAMGLHLLLAQSVWRGHGGETAFWDTSLEGFTLLAALAACTERLTLVASVPPLLYPPAVAAKMVATLDEVSGGRAGLNVVAGAHLAEYDQMGLLPTGYGSFRYDYADEWIGVVKALWGDGRLTHHGRFFDLDGCVSGPPPRRAPHPPIICAGTSERGMRFAVEHGTHAFIGTNTIGELAELCARFRARAAAAGRTTPLQIFTAVNYLLAPTAGAARELERRYRAHPDVGAIADLVGRYSQPDAGASLRSLIVDSGEHVFYGGMVVGGPDEIAAHIAAVADAGLDGLLVTFTQWEAGLDLLERAVLPAVADRLAPAPPHPPPIPTPSRQPPAPAGAGGQP
ncbi:MAG: LLM class flavin-dependent oxidoreductase [Acidimicrobiia bacterium]